jgi:hypothetical protein
LSIPGFLIFKLFAPVEATYIIVFQKTNLRRLLMQMLVRVEHCPTEGEASKVSLCFTKASCIAGRPLPFYTTPSQNKKMFQTIPTDFDYIFAKIIISFSVFTLHNNLM